MWAQVTACCANECTLTAGHVVTNVCRHVHAGDGVLFEYIDSQWRERGRGEMKMNVGVGDKARLVMRQRGNLRLLLNANIFPLFKLTPMDGGKVGSNRGVLRGVIRLLGVFWHTPQSWLYPSGCPRCGSTLAALQYYSL